MEFKTGDKIVFIGDSITDSDRRNDPEGLGNGYVRVIHDYMGLTQPEKQLTVINRGIGGDKAHNLLSRWEEDVIRHAPDWVSISVGINDEAFKIPVEDYYRDYRAFLEKTKAQTNASIIMLETTINLEVDQSATRNLDPYNTVIYELAREFSVILVPMYQVFSRYLKQTDAKVLTTDHVHMNSAGNLLMALTWLQACGLEKSVIQ